MSATLAFNGLTIKYTINKVTEKKNQEKSGTLRYSSFFQERVLRFNRNRNSRP